LIYFVGLGETMTTKWKCAIVVVALVTVLISLKAPAQDAQPASPAVHEIQMTCKKYEFSPDPIHVKKGEKVRLVITFTDRDHGIELDAFHVKQKLKKGEPTPVEFVADQAGTFTFKCSVACGLGHRGMKGTLVVEE
jgi:cytochrome c oxidase subunit 2